MSNRENMRAPPHSIEAEKSLLGGLLLDNSSFNRISGLIHVEDFYREDHRRIYAVIVNLIERNRPADVIAVAEALDSTNELNHVGGLEYLGLLAISMPPVANIYHHAEIVRENSILRQLVAVGAKICESAASKITGNIVELLDQAEFEVYRISDQVKNGQRNGFKTMEGLLKDHVSELDILYQKDSNDGISGIRTGFRDLDEMTCGLHGGDLIVIAGRTSMGKTAFAMNIGENIALREGLPVAVFCMEMPAKQLNNRLVSSVGTINLHRLKSGNLEDDDWSLLVAAVKKLSNAPILIDDSSILTVFDIRSRCRNLASQCGGKLGVIIVDSIQLMSGSTQHKDSNRASELGEISRGLKALAKELDTPVIVLSQLSRNIESRADKRPLMSDLRDSGAIEQDADLIIFMHQDPGSKFQGKTEFIISKHRNGPVGKFHLKFQDCYTRFENIDS